MIHDYSQYSLNSEFEHVVADGVWQLQHLLAATQWVNRTPSLVASLNGMNAKVEKLVAMGEEKLGRDDFEDAYEPSTGLGFVITSHTNKMADQIERGQMVNDKHRRAAEAAAALTSMGGSPALRSALARLEGLTNPKPAPVRKKALALAP